MLFSAIELIRTILQDSKYTTHVSNDENERNHEVTKESEIYCTNDDADLTHHVATIPLIEIIHGDPMTDRGSTFQSHFARVSSMTDVHNFRTELLYDKKVFQYFTSIDMSTLTQNSDSASYS